MYEIYLQCATTGQLVYGGILSDATDRKVTRESLAKLTCLACGTPHRTHGLNGWLEVPVCSPLDEAA